MLLQGALGRMTVPNPAPRNLPQLARFLQRALLARNASSQPAVRALSRAYASALQGRRSYATTAAATKPTATVKRAVKAKAAKKAPSKTKATPRTTKAAKKPASKTAASKAKPKPKKAKAKKPAPKKRVKKVLTPEEKQKVLAKELRQIALKEPVTNTAVTAYQCYVAEATRGVAESGASATSRLVEASKKFKDLTPAELEHYNHIAQERTAAKRAEFRAWIQSHTPQQILDANKARSRLRRIVKTGIAKKYPAHTQKLEDDRQPKRLRNAYTLFFAERRSSGDFKGISAIDASKLIAAEWKALSEGEKKKYRDEQVADKARYEREKTAAY
ncbi:hypothetical protein BKA63DRAFT_246760 [Paraphoma chrysanthemicola]|nr:hypothetical protein BKA63DRAFT_246760 [Paraphoma chrysanthemicola]